VVWYRRGMLRYIVFMSRRVNLNASKCAEMLQNEYDMGDVKEVPVGEGFPTQRTDIVGLIMAGAGGFEPPYGGIKILQPMSTRADDNHRLSHKAIDLLDLLRQNPTYTVASTI
jgi:hypothetical protein